ncbi:hypothetical protein OWV82_024291 [Melia azedarach]|uniref:Uncharacterized protein n=1 Tax=Melia azedarach TaxID=155640 RepID=A0ACC1WPJ9_MELAZ|nr:hypothetical protein OWV82_024291 [Melia azedarach]
MSLDKFPLAVAISSAPSLIFNASSKSGEDVNLTRLVSKPKRRGGGSTGRGDRRRERRRRAARRSECVRRSRRGKVRRESREGRSSEGAETDGSGGMKWRGRGEEQEEQ